MLLVCIYLCDADRKYLRPLHESAAGRYLARRSDTRVIDVYADEAIAATMLNGDVLTVKAPERYDSLSLKTYEMIRHCAATMTFSQLLKIDVTVARSNFDEPGYEGRSAIDLDDLARYIAAMPGDADYCGYRFLARAGKSGAEKWAAKKSRAIDYERLFGDGPMAPFYSGKCYALSHRFAQFIAARGGLMAAEHAQSFLGAEDVMIGRLFQQFSAELGAP